MAGNCYCVETEKQCHVLLNNNPMGEFVRCNGAECGIPWNFVDQDINQIQDLLVEQGFVVTQSDREYNTLPATTPKFMLIEGGTYGPRVLSPYKNWGVSLEYGWGNSPLIQSKPYLDFPLLTRKAKFSKIKKFISNNLISCDNVLKIFRKTSINSNNW